MSDFRYRLALPIEDLDLTVSQVVRQAVLVFPDIARERGIRVTGDIDARLDGERVICEADADPIPGATVSAADRHALIIAELAGAGVVDEAIAATLGLSRTTVGRVRTENGIPPGAHVRRFVA